MNISEFLFASYTTLKAQTFYNELNTKYLPKLKNNLTQTKYKIIVITGATITGFYYPLLTLIGAVVGYYLSTEYRQTPNKNIFTLENSITVMSGTIGVAMPVCTLSSLAILVGTIGVGNLIYNTEQST